MSLSVGQINVTECGADKCHWVWQICTIVRIVRQLFMTTVVSVATIGILFFSEADVYGVVRVKPQCQEIPQLAHVEQLWQYHN